jgi:hypothetical protein
VEKKPGTETEIQTYIHPQHSSTTLSKPLYILLLVYTNTTEKKRKTEDPEFPSFLHPIVGQKIIKKDDSQKRRFPMQMQMHAKPGCSASHRFASLLKSSKNPQPPHHDTDKNI